MVGGERIVVFFLFSCFRLLFAVFFFFPLVSTQLGISGWLLPSRNSYETIRGFEGL